MTSSRLRVRLALLLLICTLLASLVGTVGAATPTLSSTYGTPIANLLKRQSGDEQTVDGSSSLLPTGASEIEGQPPATFTASPRDPLLAIMPDFAFSMPAQVVVDGVNLALTTMLTIQLLFTMQYHFPLSKKNYALQSCSTVLLLISLAVHLHTVLRTLEHQSHGWPYMFAYIAVQIPPQDGSWTLVQEAFYLLMRALSTLSIHLTHIQFLTLLFPSALEARLILWMLGPLALVASGMEFTALSSDDDVKTSDLGDAIRNICNSTLFLLYTSGLLLWGLLVNRRRAWRTDGGTAAFGGGSVGLAFINTMVSFVEIAFDRLWWLPDILWTLTLWQSWLGFWWWVGSGMGIGEVEDRAERQERRRKREEKLRRKRERLEKQKMKAAAAAQNGGSHAGGSQVAAVAASVENGSDAIMGGLRRIRTRFTGGSSAAEGGQSSLSRRARNSNASRAGTAADEIELAGMRRVADEPLESIAIDDGQDQRLAANEDARTVAGSGSQSSDTHPTTSGAATSTVGWLGAVADYVATHQPNFIRLRMRRLRLAHVAAARRAATEQTVLRDQVMNRQSDAMGPGLRTMMFDNRSSTQTPLSPSLSLSGRDKFDRAGMESLTTTDSNGHGSRRVMMPMLLEHDSLTRQPSSTDGRNSIRSMSVLPDHATRSPSMNANAGARISADQARRHSLSSVARAESKGQRGDGPGRRTEVDGVTEEGEWVDDDADEGTAAPPNTSTKGKRRQGEDEDDDTSSSAADAGESSGTGRRSAEQRSPSSSWAWKGGLRSMRMRDHTTYD
jgi:hypothetical protein